MRTNPARHSLRDGLRCVARYPQIWLLPAGFRAGACGVSGCGGASTRPGVSAGGTDRRCSRGAAGSRRLGAEAVAASWLPTAESTRRDF